MNALTLFQAYLGLQLLVIAGALLTAALARLRLAPRTTLRVGRGMVLGALTLPIIMALLPGESPYRPPAQLWSEGDVTGGAVLTVAAARAGAEEVPALTATPTMLIVAASLLGLGCLLAAGRGLRGWLAVRRLVRESTVWRRSGRLELRVLPGPYTPFATLLPGAAVVVLDQATFESPEDRGPAVLHELQHHRQGDPRFAYVLALLRSLCFFNPAAAWWNRTLTEQEEMANDAALVHDRRLSARTYGSCLIRAAQRSSAVRLYPCAAGLSPTASRSLLKRRIDMLSTKPANRPLLLIPAATLCAILLVAAAWGADSLVQDRRIDPDAVEAAAERASSPEFAVPVNDAVMEAIGRLAGRERGRQFLRRGLEQMGHYEALVYDTLDRYNLPHQLAAVPLIESGYGNFKVDGESAAPPGPMGAGIWMFIPQTARKYHMRVDDEHDDRLDETIETIAAAELLFDLYEQFGDWHLALAGYNQGAGAVRQAIAEQGTSDPWELIRAEALNDYVPLIMAGAIVIEEPELVDAPTK